ncbi:hypothetical protein ABT063_34825 [Streptomyces sp. NPDC002838]
MSTGFSWQAVREYVRDDVRLFRRAGGERGRAGPPGVTTRPRGAA